MRRLVFLIVLTASLGLVASATANISTVSNLPLSSAAGVATAGCAGNHTGYAYNGVQTALGSSGFVAGAPASSISRTATISPRAGGLLSVNHHAVGYFSLTSNIYNAQTHKYSVGSWLQMGVELGIAPNNGWSAGGTQYFSSWHKYVEYSNAYTGAPNNYYYMDLGPATGSDSFTITQGTDGLFYGYANGTLVLQGGDVASASGRLLALEGEDAVAPWETSAFGCDNYSIYFKQTGTLNNSFASDVPVAHPLETCNSYPWSQYHDGNVWNRNYGQGYVPPGEVWSCPIN